MGSVLPAPLIVNSDGESLWLEHVVDMNMDRERFGSCGTTSKVAQSWT
jgi:hypothetical protein